MRLIYAHIMNLVERTLATGSTRAFILSLLGGFVLLIPLELPGQHIFSSAGGALIGSLGSVRTVHTGALAMQSNVAGLAQSDVFSLYASAEFHHYNPDISFGALSGAMAALHGVFGFELAYHGFELYREQRIGVGYARKLDDQLYIGARYNLDRLMIASYGSAINHSGQLGLISRLGPSVQMGVTAYRSFRRGDEDLDRADYSIAMGLRCDISTMVILYSEIRKHARHPPMVHAGMEYATSERFTLMAGVSSEPATVSMGVSYRWRTTTRLSLGSRVHPVLGLSSLAGFGYKKSRL